MSKVKFNPKVKKILLWIILPLYGLCVVLFLWQAFTQYNQRIITPDLYNEKVILDEDILVNIKNEFKAGTQLEGTIFGLIYEDLTDRGVETITVIDNGVTKDVALSEDLKGKGYQLGENLAASYKIKLVAGTPITKDINKLLMRDVSLVSKEIKVKGEGQIIGINGTFIFQWLNFAVLVLVLYGLLWQPVISMIDKRAEKIRKDLEDADKLKDDSQKKFNEYTELLSNSKIERSALIEDGQKIAEKEKDRIIQQSKEEAEEILKDARVEIDAQYNKAKKALEKEIASLSIELASKILKREVTQENNKDIIDDFLAKIETSKMDLN